MLFVVAVAVVGTYIASGKTASVVESDVSGDIVLLSGDKPIDVVSVDDNVGAKGNKKQDGKLYSLSYGKQDTVSGDDSVQVWIE